MDINYYKKYEPIDGKWYITRELGSGACKHAAKNRETEKKQQNNGHFLTSKWKKIQNVVLRKVVM